MNANVSNVNAGDTIIYNGFNVTSQYLITFMKSIETLDEESGEVTIKASMTGKNTKDGSYNNFFSLADGSFPNLNIIS